MRMPFLEFITSGDLKFIIVFIVFIAISIYHLFKKIAIKKLEGSSEQQVKYHNLKISNAAFWILISSVLSLLLGLLHSFYFIGQSGGVAPSLIFQGVSYALITPVLGLFLFVFCHIFKGIFNLKTSK